MLNTTRFAKLTADFPRDGPKPFSPELYNTFREVLFLFESQNTVNNSITSQVNFLSSIILPKSGASFGSSSSSSSGGSSSTTFTLEPTSPLLELVEQNREMINLLKAINISLGKLGTEFTNPEEVE